ncbi:MAG TPA: ABA4-like family protein [Allosphingosinicella sp.]|nr:ABA4-like family protein [Allosphingosinicella sp.]
MATLLDPTFAFALANNFGLLAWAALLLSLFVARIRIFVWPATQFAIPLAWALLYVILLAQGLPVAEGGFDSIEGVRGLFANDSALTAGWLHYLAFDLFVGTWIARDSVERKVPGLLVAPCLALTLMFGPAGLLAYFLLRLAFARRADKESVS